MTLDEFKALFKRTQRDRPLWQWHDRAPPARDDQIESAQRALNVRLPRAYIDVLKVFGGGEFPLINVYSVDPENVWYIVDQNEDFPIPGFIAVSDDQTGGFYGFRVESGQCRSEIHYWDRDDGSITGPHYENLFDFIAEHGLSH